ncbi:MAG: aminodeoxychorismate/anthranilate synthase component II [Bacteroidota bacterium]
MRILLIDNYDSFTYNLSDYFQQIGVEVTVYRNDELKLEEFINLYPDAIVLSPGPGRPADAGLLMPLIAHFHNKLPMLGICLGHQALGEFFGATLVKASIPVHGKTSLITRKEHPVYKGLPETFNVMRYHSLILESLDGTGLIPVAYTMENELMAMYHSKYPLFGIQYHPESILTDYGKDCLANWVSTIPVKKSLSHDPVNFSSVLK